MNGEGQLLLEMVWPLGASYVASCKETYWEV